MRVLHLPTSVGANSLNLSYGERRLGIESKVLLLKKYDYIVNQSNDLKYDYLLDYSEENILYPFKVAKFYKSIIDEFDIFHFNFGTTLMSYKNPLLDMIDLSYLKAKKKKIVVTYQGDDARQNASNLYCENKNTIQEKRFMEKEEEHDQLKKRRIDKFNRYAEFIWTLNPDVLKYLPQRARFRPYSHILADEWCPVYSDYREKSTQILHAPTNRLVKGTDAVIDAVNSLKADGYSLELELLENIPKEKAILRYKNADIVIDQLKIGFYGGFAVEAMALGKPVIAYINESDMKKIPLKMREQNPIIQANTKNVYFVLKYYLENKEKLAKIAVDSRKYAVRWHDIDFVAGHIIKAYEHCFQEKK